jgi:hypothetical protein
MNQTDLLLPILSKLKEASGDNNEKETLEIVNQIFLLRLKRLILVNIKKEDLDEFEKVIRLNNSSVLLNFASEKIPDFSDKVSKLIKDLTQEFHFQNNSI